MKKDEKNLYDHFVVSQNLMFAGFAAILSAILFQSTDFVWFLFGLGFLLMLASIFYATKYYKCPHCGTKLDPRRKVPNFCPHCGKNLF